MNIWVNLLLFIFIYIILKVCECEFIEGFENIEGNKKIKKHTLNDLNNSIESTLNYLKSYYKTKRISILNLANIKSNYKNITFTIRIYNYDKLNVKILDVIIKKPILKNQAYKVIRIEEHKQKTNLKLASVDTLNENTWFYKYN